MSDNPMNDQRVRCQKCEQRTARALPDEGIVYCTDQSCAGLFYNAVDAVRMANYRPPPRVTHGSFVYYIRWGDRIKIGTSTDVRSRLGQLYYDELLAIEPGGYAHERERHTQFAEYRYEKYREWFNIAPALMFHINTIRSKYPALVEEALR